MVSALWDNVRYAAKKNTAYKFGLHHGTSMETKPEGTFLLNLIAKVARSLGDSYSVLIVPLPQVDALLEDRRVRMEESQALHDRDTERIKGLSDQLHMTQNLLYDSTKDYLDLKYEFRARERQWMTEKDQLLRQLDHFREQLDVSEGVDPVLGMAFADDTPRRRGATSKQLQLQLLQAQQLADNYRDQCISMEEELCKLREEAEASKDLFKQRTDKTTKRLGLMNSRYEALEKRRALEIEGYKNDIKLLRQRMKELERQLFKVRWYNGPILSYLVRSKQMGLYYKYKPLT